MRPLFLLAIYLIAVFVGGALLAPWLYLLTQWSAQHWPALGGVAKNPFSRFVVRSLLGLAIIGLWPLLRGCGMRHRREMGLEVSGRALLNLALGFVIGFASLTAVAGLAILCGARTANLSQTGPEMMQIITGATATAAVVAVLEELIFRGALFGILRKATVWPVALIVSSAIYAALHFLQKPAVPVSIDWLSGFRMLPDLFRSQPGGLEFIPAYFTLLVAGAILALAYQRTGTLFMSIGLHAGWIFWLTAYRSLTREAPSAHRAIWGTDKLIDGWLAFAILVVVLVTTWRYGPGKPGSTAGQKP